MIQTGVTILLVEDDDGHAELIRLNLSRAGIGNPTARVRDGQEALEYIRGEGRHGGRSAGSIVVLLDINLPVLDGIETLKCVKSDPATAQIPIVMLTTTDDPREVSRCYELGCNAYISKPVDYDLFGEAIRHLAGFIPFVRCPRTGAPGGSRADESE